MSKGSNRRPEDYKKVSDNWEKIFGKQSRRRETANRPRMGNSDDGTGNGDSETAIKPGLKWFKGR